MSRGGVILWGTAALKRLLGYGPELRGQDVMVGAPAEQREEIAAVFEEIQSGDVVRLTAPILTATGETRIAESVFRRRHGRVYHYLVRLLLERRAVPRQRKRIIRQEVPMLLALVVLAQVATATPAPKLSGGFGTPATTRRRIVITDVSSSRAGSFSVAGTRGAPQPIDQPMSPSQADELAWRERSVAAKQGLVSALEALARADKANTVVTFGSGRSQYHQLALQMREANLAPYRSAAADARAAVDALPEDCRRTPGCQPGWLR